MRKWVFGVVPMLLGGLSLAAQHPHRIMLAGTEVRIGKPVAADTSENEIVLNSDISIKKISRTVYQVRVSVLPEKTHHLGEIELQLDIPVQTSGGRGSVKRPGTEDLKNSFHWVPNIKTSPGQIIPQHVFRSPCIILSLDKQVISFIPDIRQIKADSPAPFYFDLQYLQDTIRIRYGVSHYDVVKHQYYKKSGRPFEWTSKLDLDFYLLVSAGSDPLAALQNTNAFLWENFAGEYTRSYLPQKLTFREYAEVAYPMALEHYWVNGSDTTRGGITLSTFYDEAEKKYGGRFYKNDLWYHSWFNNIRTAYGLYYWGSQTGREEWKQKALATVNLLTSSPRVGGWFPTIYVSAEDRWVESGQGGGAGLFHMPDNAWTAYWLMRFNNELHPVEGADSLTLQFALALLNAQDADGSFPARVRAAGLEADMVLRSSASSAIASWYLAEMLLSGKIPDTLRPALLRAVQRSVDFLSTAVLPLQRFDDFELYFSCSPKPMYYYDSSTMLYGQNTLAIQWCAEAYLKAFRLFGDTRYLRQGEYCLNILSLYQQVWNPPFINLYAFGGFGVQNTDAEWSDARQAQFAETYLNYYYATNRREYLERAIFACRASFALMVIPENREIAPENYLGTSFNGESYPGTMAENFGHSGYNKRSYQSGFHWGTGSALTSAAILKHALGDLYVDKNIAIGVDAIVVEQAKWTAKSVHLQTRNLRRQPVNVNKHDSVKKKIVVSSAY